MALRYEGFVLDAVLGANDGHPGRDVADGLRRILTLHAEERDVAIDPVVTTRFERPKQEESVRRSGAAPRGDCGAAWKAPR